MTSLGTQRKRRSMGIVALGVGALVVVAALVVPIALASPGSGTSSQILGHRATLSESVETNTDRIKFQTKDQTDFQMQTITFAPGGQSGWHHHPGVIWVIVESGAVTIYDGNCQVAQTVTAGHAFIESGSDTMLVRNEGTVNAVVYNAQVVPAGSPFRTEDDPPACAS